MKSEEQREEKCSSPEIPAKMVNNAARVVAKAFLAGDKKIYGPIDRLASATSPESILTALFEIDRGVRAELGEKYDEEATALAKVLEAIASDVRRLKCLEEALRLAHELAVKALAYTEPRQG